MSFSPNLKLPYIDANQNQKSVTHNQALRALDALVNLRVASTTLAAPPAAPSDGQCWIVASGATGAWLGKDLNVAAWQDGAWAFYAPNPGFVAYVDALGGALLWNGSAWVSLLGAIASLGLATLGIGTAADAGNPLSAKLNAALLAALPTTASPAGTGDVRVKLSKQAAGNTASFLFQDNFSGRAEIGLAGDDNFHFKVSADGTTFRDALVLNAATADASILSLNGGPLGGFRNRIVNGNFAVNQRGQASGAALAAGAYGHDRWRAGASGCTYAFTPAKPDTTVTITAGTLVQVVEDAAIEGGTYTLSWAGTAQGRVVGVSGSVAAGPLVVSGLAAGAAVTVEFATGTLGRVQLEPGLVATPFERRPLGSELTLCQRYYYRRPAASNRDVICMMSAFSATQAWGKMFDLPAEMRAMPAVSYSNLSHLFIWTAAGAPYTATALDMAAGSSSRSVGCYNGLTAPSGAGFSPGQALFLTFCNAAGWIDAAAEL